MFVKQLSVFMENREGRLEKATEILKEHGINDLGVCYCKLQRDADAERELPCSGRGTQQPDEPIP